MNIPQKIVMFDSPKAAEYKTGLSGWVSRHGRYYGDSSQAEMLARYDGCTHHKCRSCEYPTRKEKFVCDVCQEKSSKEAFDAMPSVPWSGEMLYSRVMDRFYKDLTAAQEELDNCLEIEQLQDLQLIICKPNYVATLSDAIFSSYLAEDSDAPTELVEAIYDFNEKTKNVILSWSPGNTKLLIE